MPARAVRGRRRRCAIPPGAGPRPGHCHPSGQRQLSVLKGARRGTRCHCATHRPDLDPEDPACRSCAAARLALHPCAAGRDGAARLALPALPAADRAGVSCAAHPGLGTGGGLCHAGHHPPAGAGSAALGAVGLAVGLGAQDGIRNLLAGVMMIFNPPFRIGDMVRFGGYYGEVVGMDLSVTWLRTFDDSRVMVPNAELLRNAVANANCGELAELVEIPIDLPLGVALAEARALAEEAARASPYTFLKKPVVVTIAPRYEYGFVVRMTIKAYVIDVRLERVMASDIAERALQALFERSIVTPALMAGALPAAAGAGQAA
ncbi:MAG: mechanosensitive ion channel [Rhodocyclaceae bacterium]|nr:mechanosensitive ion channel [Rhodocyclaceae bacterium]